MTDWIVAAAGYMPRTSFARPALFHSIPSLNRLLSPGGDAPALAYPAILDQLGTHLATGTREAIIRLNGNVWRFRFDIEAIGIFVVLTLLVLLVFTLLCALVARRRAAEAKAANERLLHEIKDRRQAEQAHAHLAAIVESSEDSIVGKALDGVILSWNSGAQKLYGYSASEVLGQPISLLVPPGGSNELPDILEKVRNGGRIDNYETVRQRKDGSLVEVSVTISPVRDDAGRIIAGSAVTRDITARKKLERMLLEESTLVQMAHDAIIVRDPHGTIIKWNTGAAELYGWTEEEAIGKVTHTLLQTQTPGNVDVDVILSCAGHWEGELVHRHRDGKQVLVESRQALARAAGGTPIGVLEVNRDIGERRMAEQKFRALFESAPDAIISCDAAGVIVAANSQAERAFGYSREELLGLTIDALVPQRHSTAHASHRAAFALHPEMRPMGVGREVMARRKDGAEFSVEITLSPVKTQTGFFIASVIRDITERKRVEQALRSSEAQYRLLFENNALPMWVFDAGTLAFLAVNDAAVHHYGYSREEFLGMTIRDIRPPEDLPSLMSAMSAASGEIIETMGVWRHYKKNREVIEVEVTFHAFFFQGRDARFVVANDITARRRAERDLQALSGRLLQLQDEERRRVARELHDTTGQGLAALKINLSLLADPALSTQPQSQQIVSESLAIAELCSDEIRTLSYLLHPPLLEELGLAAALRAYLDGYAKRTGLAARLEVSPEVGRLSADAEIALFRVAQEALGNVHRHSGSRSVEVRLACKGNEVILGVRDAGRGMLAEVLERMESRTPQLGVGIAGMRERLRQLGGHLEFESADPGTLVQAVLPFKQSAAAAAATGLKSTA